jgi:hypothetical protein
MFPFLRLDDLRNLLELLASYQDRRCVEQAIPGYPSVHVLSIEFVVFNARDPEYKVTLAVSQDFFLKALEVLKGNPEASIPRSKP